MLEKNAPESEYRLSSAVCLLPTSPLAGNAARLQASAAGDVGCQGSRHQLGGGRGGEVHGSLKQPKATYSSIAEIAQHERRGQSESNTPKQKL